MRAKPFLPCELRTIADTGQSRKLARRHGDGRVTQNQAAAQVPGLTESHQMQTGLKAKERATVR